MTEDSRPEVVEEIITKIGRDRAEHDAAQEAARTRSYATTDGVRTTDKFERFVKMVREGTLPDPGEVPEAHPDVARMIEELSIVHLPEWRTPTGRKMADPSVVRIPQMVRIAQYLVEQRGWRWEPGCERTRWAPTPGGPSGPYDTGLHYERDETGQWPVLDPEAFWDIDDIRTEQLPDGTWSAAHPRGIAFTAGSKSEAHAGLVGRIRTKIEEAAHE